MAVYGAMTSSLPPEIVIKPGHVPVVAGRPVIRSDVADARTNRAGRRKHAETSSSLVVYTVMMYCTP